MLAHIRNGSIIRRYSSSKGWVTLEDGRLVSPPVTGFADGNDRVVPVETETTDNSTGPDKRTETVETVEAARVLREVTIRDATSQELSDQADNEIEDQFTRDLKNFALAITNEVRALKSQNPITMQQLANYIKGLR